MTYKGTLIVVKDCGKALRFYHDLFGLELVQDNDGNMQLTHDIWLQEEKYWTQFTGRQPVPRACSSELYFEEPEIEAFAARLAALYPETEFVCPMMTHSWGQTVMRFFDPDGNLIEVGTPVSFLDTP